NGSGEVTAEITIPEQFQGYPGVVHGGIVAAMLDEIAGRSMMGGDPPRFMFTARLDIRYRRNVPVAQPLVLTGKAGSSKGRTATATGRICDSEGNLLAEAEALLVNVPDEMVDKTYLEALGWKVYPDE
ncbi:MAG: PaaI family thioesterase, partial [Omnitrophica WOR_2 bacterium]